MHAFETAYKKDPMTFQPQSSYNREEILACSRGELFGPGNARLPAPNMLMADRIVEINNTGGAAGKGEIIAELEPETRGAYAGGVGYFAPDGSVDSCIVLRTAVVKDGVMHVQAGAGIVADSDPEYELNECKAKAGALIAAAQEAARIASEPGFGQ